MLKLKPCPFCGGKMRILGKDPAKIGIVMDCTECYIRVAVPWAYDAEHGIPAFNKRASGWIPCSERMPEECERVLAIIDGVVRESLYEYDAFQGSSFYRDKSTVTHWMPLPEPPEIKEDNND